MCASIASVGRHRELTCEEQFTIAKTVVEEICANIHDINDPLDWFQLDVSISSDQTVWVELTMDTTDFSCVLWRSTDGFQFTDRIRYAASPTDADVFKVRLIHELLAGVTRIINNLQRFSKLGFRTPE